MQHSPRRTLILGALRSAIPGAALLAAPAAGAATADDVLAAYLRFAAAQNARDIATVRSLLLDSPRFLWVSNGQSFWGRETMIARMSSYQRAEVWEVRPDLAHAVVVEVADAAAYLHLPLALDIGSAADGIARTEFLVSALFVRADAAWKIAALFTTVRNPG